MAYRLRPHETVEHGLRRLVRKELDNVRARLRRGGRPSDEAIHEARKRIKKVRSIVRLFRADGGHGVRKAWKQLRKVNGLLSRLRDAAATLEILATLRKRFPAIIDRGIYLRTRRPLLAAGRN